MREGKDVTIVAFSRMVQFALEVRERERKGETYSQKRWEREREKERHTVKKGETYSQNENQTDRPSERGRKRARESFCKWSNLFLR